tara:strand:- start:149 stop:1105 length:957 start_codon:yes stop_codon:yes gene_type:complete
MTWNKFTNGTVADATEVNANFSFLLTFPILNKIRQQIDRSVSVSLNKDDIFSDAFIDASGRENYVNTGNTTAGYSGAYKCKNWSTTVTTQTETPNNDTDTTGITSTFVATDDCIITELIYKPDGSSGTTTFKFTFSVNSVVLCEVSDTAPSLSTSKTFTLTASDWGAVIESGDTVDFVITRTGGVARIGRDNTTVFASSTLITTPSSEFMAGSITATQVTATNSTSSIVEMDIPTGTFSSTVNKLTGKSMIASTETTATIEHRLENATEDSGWILGGDLGSFTALTSEPTKYKIRLTSASSAASFGVPAIKGSGVYSQ